MKLLLPLALCVGTVLSKSPTHGWNTALEGQFIDFGYSCPSNDKGKCVGNTPFTPERAKAVAEIYPIVSIEKCAGPNDNTEEAIWESAKLLKSFNPNVLVYFYLNSNMDGFACYAMYDYYLSQTQWHLKNDTGGIVHNAQGVPLLDYANTEATDWWANIPLNGTMYSDIIDGVLADISGPPKVTGIAEPRYSALVAGKAAMITNLQAKFKATNDGAVLQNVLTFYENDHHEDWLQYSDGAMAEHFAVFESADPQTGKLNATRVTEYLDTVTYAASLGKFVVMATWPGVYTDVMKWANDTQPTTIAGWKEALVQKHTFALAGYLTVAEPTVYMQYEMWYEGFAGGAVPCPTDPASCPAPDPWYPDLYKPLGAPLGPATRVGNVFTRKFEHATSTLNLDDPDASTVVYF